MMLQWTNFLGGLWVADSPEVVAPANALRVADNIDYLPSGAIRGRRGRIKYNATPLPDDVYSLWRHYPRTGAPATLAAVKDGAQVNLYHDTASNGTFSVIAGGTGFANDMPFRFAFWPSKNKTFLTNGVATMRTYAAGTLTDLGSTPKKGPYLTVWQSRLWATDPNELNYSVYASEINDETTWPAGNHLNLSDREGGLITGLLGVNDKLILLKTTGLWRFHGDITFGGSLAQYSDEGCIAPNTVQPWPGGVIYLARAGFRVTDGERSTPLDVSPGLQALFVQRADQTIYSTAVGISYARRNQYLCSLEAGQSPAYVLTRITSPDGKTTALPWAKNTVLGMQSACAWDAESEDGTLLVGDRAGQVWIVDANSPTDNGVSFTSTIETVPQLLDPLALRSGRVTTVRTIHRATEALNGLVSYYYTGTGTESFTIGTPLGALDLAAQEARAKLWDMTKQGRTCTLRLSTGGIPMDFELYRVDLETRVRSLRSFPS
jgi:hypothetical protein